MSFRKRHIRWLLVLGPLLLLGASCQPGAYASTRQDERAIRALVWASQRAQQTLLIPPRGYRNNRPIPAPVMHKMLRRIKSELKKYYAGGRLQQLLSVMQRNARAEQSGKAIIVGGGVRSISYNSISISGDRATAKAEVVKWLKGSGRDADGRIRVSTPRGTDDVSEFLVRTAARWRIERETFVCVAGCP